MVPRAANHRSLHRAGGAGSIRAEENPQPKVCCVCMLPSALIGKLPLLTVTHRGGGDGSKLSPDILNHPFRLLLRTAWDKEHLFSL